MHATPNFRILHEGDVGCFSLVDKRGTCRHVPNGSCIDCDSACVKSCLLGALYQARSILSDKLEQLQLGGLLWGSMVNILSNDSET